ncbi:LUD domain-containing protein [Chitinophaga sp. MM2321]|uniref:LutC/YkgG family protein n=1 Tax=Chitinophaga sp. MM2321 TaxID=3137178 RepID=UPI0032D59F52
MKTDASRENILQRIEDALSRPVPLPFPAAQQDHSFVIADDEDLTAMFTTAFTSLQGQLVLCSGKEDLFKKMKTLAEQKAWKHMFCKTPEVQQDLFLYGLPFISTGSMQEADVSITDCICLVARTGAIVLSAAQSSGRALPVYAPIQIVVAFRHQLVYNIKNALQEVQEKYTGKLPSAIFFVAGPSRTGDIERTLVMGVHGPREVYVFLVNE